MCDYWVFYCSYEPIPALASCIIPYDCLFGNELSRTILNNMGSLHTENATLTKNWHYENSWLLAIHHGKAKTNRECYP